MCILCKLITRKAIACCAAFINCLLPNIPKPQNISLTIGLSNTLQLILLLDGIRVAASLGGVDELFGQALGNTLDVAEGGLTGTNCKKSDGLVDAAERGNINGLATDGTSGSDTGAVFARTAVDNGINGDLDRVLVGHDVNDLKGVGHDADGLEFFTVVATVHHEGAGETLNDGALSLSEALDGISTSRVRDVDWCADLDVIGQRDIPNLNILVAPLVEQLDAANLVGDLFGENSIVAGALNLDLFVVGHCE